jgi:hypothetical protein
MAYDRYQIADQVTVGPIHAKKGILVLGGGTCAVSFYRTRGNGETAGSVPENDGAVASSAQAVQGTVQGAIFPVAVHTLLATAGCTVYRLG